MKKRFGFVSNSSSSSFIINKKDLTVNQYQKILNHRDVADEDAWYIEETEDELTGTTGMDNFSMYEYMEKLGIDMSKIDWDD